MFKNYIYNAVKSLPIPIITLAAYSLLRSTFQKFIFKIQLFLVTARTKIPLKIHQKTPFQVKTSFWGQGLAFSPDPLPLNCVVVDDLTRDVKI